ncbi:MAG: NADH-quinone oxidoreductase subunit C [FCB group bacterium]|nr:NADH-quinone oxidoreductase subunit C [FCB group bacterium]
MEDKIRTFFNSNFSEAVIKEDDFRQQQSFYIKPEFLVEICEALLDDDDLDVKFLSDITSLDWLGHEEEKNGRFEVIYNLYSLSHHYRFFIKVRLDGKDPKIGSLTDLWAGANWLECEVFDLMGIYFEGHPHLTKILTPEDLEGHPLRKDFPLTWEQPVFNWNKGQPPEVIK